MKSYVVLMLIIITLPIFIFGMSYLLNKRKTMNFIMTQIPNWSKRYVVVHMMYAQTKQSEVYYVIPKSAALTPVKDRLYDLHEKFALYIEKGRKHYVIEYEDTIPKTFEKNDLIFQASEIKSAFQNTVVEKVFSSRKDNLVLLIIIAVAVNIIISLYMIYTYKNQVTP